VLVAAEGVTLESLPQGARVGTGSLRRRTQLLAARPDLQILPLRGNIDTRLRKQREGEYDAIVLAMAGLRRGGLFDAGTMTPLPPETLTPAAGQGALAIQCRAADAATIAAVASLHDPDTARCVDAERAVILALNADCHSPVGVYATLDAGRLSLTAVYTEADGPLRRAAGDDPAVVAAALLSSPEHGEGREGRRRTRSRAAEWCGQREPFRVFGATLRPRVPPPYPPLEYQGRTHARSRPKPAAVAPHRAYSLLRKYCRSNNAPPSPASLCRGFD
jgi:hypothetical protein